MSNVVIRLGLNGHASSMETSLRECNNSGPIAQSADGDNSYRKWNTLHLERGRVLRRHFVRSGSARPRPAVHRDSAHRVNKSSAKIFLSLRQAYVLPLGDDRTIRWKFYNFLPQADAANIDKWQVAYRDEMLLQDMSLSSLGNLVVVKRGDLKLGESMEHTQPYNTEGNDIEASVAYAVYTK